MVLDRHRSRLDWWLVPLARGLRRVDPDVFTWLSLVAALGGGLAFALSGPDAAWLLWVGWALVLTNSVLDLLDGKVAVMTGKASARGDYLDHTIDRFSDTAFLLGLALSPWVRVEVGMLAIVFTLLTSYLGTQAQAVGIGRNYGGLLGRADRMALLWIVPPLTAALAAGPGADWRLAGFATTPLELMLAYFALIGFVTTLQRFVFGLRGFGADGKVK